MRLLATQLAQGKEFLFRIDICATGSPDMACPEKNKLHQTTHALLASLDTPRSDWLDTRPREPTPILRAVAVCFEAKRHFQPPAWAVMPFTQADSADTPTLSSAEAAVMDGHT